MTKLNATGSGLVFSTYLGGSIHDIGDRHRRGRRGQRLRGGQTRNPPISRPPQGRSRRPTPRFGVTFDAFVTKLDATGSGLVFSTYLGGSGRHFGRDIAVDGAGSAYVAGVHALDQFPDDRRGRPNDQCRRVADAFMTKLEATGSGLVFSTYLGGSSDDVGFGIAVDVAGSAYVAGETSSTDFPTTAGRPRRPTPAAFCNAFVTKLNATGLGLVFSTYLGGSRPGFRPRHCRGRRG